MGHKVVISSKESCVYTWFFDVVTDDDLADLIRQIRTSPEFQPRFNELVDLSAAASFAVSTSGLEEAGYACSSLFSAPAKRVIVAPSDVAYGVSRMFQAFAQQQKSDVVYVVRTKAEGCSLLDMDEEKLPRMEVA